MKLNNNKTVMFFRCNTNPETKAHILTVAGVSATQSYEKYLGLLALIGAVKSEYYSGIKGKVWELINGWEEKFLSQARREVLLKDVIQVIPTYTMSEFQLPKTLCKDLNSMMGWFWWRSKENELKIA